MGFCHIDEAKPDVLPVANLAECPAKIGLLEIKKEPGIANGVAHRPERKAGIAAEAEADANAQIAASLTPELIEKIKYEKWNGELPTVSGSNAIVSMEGLK